MGKTAIVDFAVCDPRECEGGVCKASQACPRKLLVQEEPHDTPMLLSATLCSGCAKCVRECPRGALILETGG